MLKFYIFIFFLLFISCKNKSDEHKGGYVHEKYTLVHKKTKTFNNTDKYYYTFLSQVVNNDNGISVLRHNIRANYEGFYSLNFLNPDSAVRNRKLSFDQMNRLKRIENFYQKTNDSLIVIGMNKFLILNDKNETVHESFYNPPQNNNYFPVSSGNITKSFMIGDDLFFTRIVDLSPGKEKHESNTLMKYNIKKDTLIEMNNTGFSKMYFESCWAYKDYWLGYTLNNLNQLVYFYPIDDSVYVYSIGQEKIIKSKQVRSKYKKNDVKDIACDEVWDVKTNTKHDFTSFSYRNIIYDKYKDIYYRLAELPREEFKINHKYNSLNNFFIIMVLDKDLNIIHESEIFNKTPKFVPFDYFVSEEGLWISTNNPENPNYNEDELSFELFEFKKKK